MGEECVEVFENQGSVWKVSRGESRCSVWGHGAVASQWRVLWPEGIGNLSVQRSGEAEGDGIAGRRCSRGTFQDLPLPQTPAASRLKYFWLDLTQATFRLLSL